MKRETIDLFNRIFKVLEPPPDLTLSQWADRYRRLSSESGSKGGKWNTEKAPWQREIMDAITDISVEKVVVMSAAQMGKTDAFLLNTIGYYMHYDPCTILCMQPTLSLAETMSKDRLMPMVRDTPALRDKINEKSRTAGNTIFKKAFPGGRITMSGANSINWGRLAPQIIYYVSTYAQLVADGEIELGDKINIVVPTEIGRASLGKECRSRWSPYH